MSVGGRDGIILRAAEVVDDFAFARRSWCNQTRRCKPLASLDDQAFRRHVDQVILSAIERCGLLMAAHEDDPSLLVGFICAERWPSSSVAVVHMLYVKRARRGEGVARLLLGAALGDRRAGHVAAVTSAEAIYYTHQTRYAPRFGAKFGAVFDPYRSSPA